MISKRRFREVLQWTLLQVLLLTGCAKTGEPQPPRVLIPKPAVDLSVRQLSDQIELAFSMPVENTDGSPVTTLAEVEVLRVSEDRTGSPEALPEAAFLERAERILRLPLEQLSTYLQGTTLVVRDGLVFEDRSVIYGRGFRYAVRFINRKNQTAGLSNQFYVAPVPIPASVSGLSFQLAQDHIRIRWEAPNENMDRSGPPRIAGYNIYRSEDTRRYPGMLLNSTPVEQTEFLDRDFQFDTTYYYAVSVLGRKESPPAESRPSAVLPVTAVDTFPPAAPENLQVFSEEGVVVLLWTAPPVPDLAGYRVYRTMKGSEEKSLLNDELLTVPSFRDEKASSGQAYEYRVAAVDTHNNEGPSAQGSIELP